MKSHHSKELANPEIQKARQQMVEQVMFHRHEAKAEATCDFFQCSKCKEKKTTYYQLQTRSADEPMTTFVTCVVCACLVFILTFRIVATDGGFAKRYKAKWRGKEWQVHSARLVISSKFGNKYILYPQCVNCESIEIWWEEPIHTRSVVPLSCALPLRLTRSCLRGTLN